MVAPKRRMSGSVPDAENRGRVAIGMPACSDDAQPVNSELEWKHRRPPRLDGLDR